MGRALPLRGHDLILRRANQIDDNGNAVVVKVKDTWRLIYAVSRAHAHFAVDLDFEAHGAIVRFQTLNEVDHE